VPITAEVTGTFDNCYLEITLESSPVRLEGPSVIVRTLQYDDLEQIDNWRPFDEPLQALWAVPHNASVSRAIWFTMYQSDPTRLWYTVERRKDRRVIGTLSLREINYFVSARLGIGFGADFVDQGYGTEALCVFFPYYFRTLDFQRLILDVAAANRRALHVYEKLAFQRVGSHYRPVPEGVDLSFLREARYRNLRHYFRHRFGQTQLLYYDMVLERDIWEKHLHSNDLNCSGSKSRS